MRQRGFSMVELLIAVTIGLLLVSGLLSAYVASLRTHRFQAAMTQTQETGRFLLNKVKFEFRNAGYGLDASAPAISGFINGAAAGAALPPGTLIANPGLIHNGDIVYIYPHDGVAGGVGYYIADFLDNNGNARASLYRNNQPLAEGVERMLAEYGEDIDDDNQIDRFVGQAAIGDWAKVKAVRLSFLVAADDNVLSSAQPLPGPFGGNAADRRLYRSFTTTVGIRNKLLGQ